jgi:ATP-dependent Lon protease
MNGKIMPPPPQPPKDNIILAHLPLPQSTSTPQDINNLVDKKMDFFQDIIQKTIIHVNQNKLLDILGVGEVNSCINSLNILSEKVKKISQISNTETIINSLQLINNDLSAILKIYGTESLDDLLTVCFGNNNSIIIPDPDLLKYELLKKYFHPTSYRVVIIKSQPESKIEINAAAVADKDKPKTKKIVFLDEFIDPVIKNLDCIDISLNVKPFHLKVYGIKMYIYNSTLKTTLLINGIVDDIIIGFLNNKYINSMIEIINNPINKPNNSEFQGETFNNFIMSLTLKDYLTNSNFIDIYNKYNGYLNQYKSIKQKTLAHTVNDFISSDLYIKRNILIQLLINVTTQNNKYMAYLLYDVLSNDSNGSIDTHEQVMLFDSFPWSIKQYFRDAMKKTIQYTNDLSNFDINKIPLEQQICLLKASDSVKERAMMKLKEIKAKSEDSGSKSRQYLDGLLKIPFNVYIKEPVMNIMDDIRRLFLELITTNAVTSIPQKDKYTSLEIVKYIKMIKANNDQPEPNNKMILIAILVNALTINLDKNELIMNIMKLNDIIVSQKIAGIHKITYSGKKKSELCTLITDFINRCYKKYADTPIIDEINKLCKINNLSPPSHSPPSLMSTVISKNIDQINTNFNTITEYIKNVRITLDEAVYGHEKAKGQIEKIIGQWVNGNHDGYCFGFEGAPGLGKTSLAKRGLSNCLKDELGNSRPFAMIAMGGDANGSTLHGHNYTYVGSTWGSIVQILMDKKCMNPIIFIDEVDKISKTEHGREIVGILTHLLDSTQNDSFQDKYFSGIDLDLSKVLFILSYNDPEAIDKILLDRIHRIKFTNLSLEDKLVVANTHMLPDIYKKFGLEDMIHFNNEAITFIIENYTCEAGVRKMKEKLFEIVGDINIDILKNQSAYTNIDFPIEITIDDIKNKYFKDKQEVRIKKIHGESRVGIANGMWANAAGQGGTLPIEAKFYPCETFMILKLTGMQGDVMQESMNVALTLAYSLTPPDRCVIINDLYNSKIASKYGIHMHTPEGSVSKNGPSAGSCITTVIYSLLNNRKIKYNFAMTGEITLDGSVTAIGGLDHKIIGSIKAGVTAFIFPEENKRDFEKFMEKYAETALLKDKNIQFYPVSKIQEVFDLILEQ